MTNDPLSEAGEVKTVRQLAEALSAGLDLCIRARRMDSQDRTNAMVEAFPGADMEKVAPRLNENYPDQPYMTKSATIPLWIEDQYQKDLAAWEASTRALLMRLPAFEVSHD